MMKKWSIVVVSCIIMISMVSVASANTVREDCGCGLGAIAIGEKEGVLWKLLGTFLNGLSGNQTFGMSSGTSDCGKDQWIAKYDKMNIFVADNMDILAIDIAQGQGESLDALAEIAEIPIGERPSLYAALQSNFDSIYPTAQVSHTDVVKEIAKIIQPS
ncbi:MAG: hypothetical protein AVO38_06400 [delta proteobacterium ML8_D]|nr:MAG: hypothetical protein AVO38_06400 [delta proteobacterium ML8_D]